MAGWCRVHGSSHPESEKTLCSSAEAPSFQQRAAARPEWNLLECSLLLRPYQCKRVQQALLHELAITKHLTIFGGGFVRKYKTLLTKAFLGVTRFCSKSVMGLQFSLATH